MFPKFSELIIIVIFIFFNISNISNYQELPYLNDTYDYNDVLPALTRYVRQTPSVSCVVPVYPGHTKYKILNQRGTRYTRSGDLVPNFATVGIICDKGYKLNPLAVNYSVCVGGSWTPPLKICARACPSLTSLTSTNVICTHGTTPLDNCDNPVEATIAQLSCNPLYEGSTIENNPIHLCSDGRWEPSIPQCYPTCGQKRPLGKVNIINGADTVRGDYPWHVGIYKADKSYLCGGAIIEPNIVLSAAHCFTDFEGNVFPPENYIVAAGKYYRTYDHASDEYAQYSKIQKFNIPERYKGATTLQALDIAVLILESPFTITSAVQPVCIELNEQLQQLHLSSNSIGIVTGWGYTQEGGELANVLKEVEIPYIPYQKCYDEIPMNFKRYVSQDKLCGGYKDSETSICTGDSGGGLVFNNLITDRFYIKGVVSTSPATVRRQCDSNQYSLYTSIVAHIKFIRDAIITNRLRNYVQCKYDKCASEEPKEVPEEEEVEEVIKTDENADTCCAQGARCKYFYFACGDQKTVFKRMVEMIL